MTPDQTAARLAIIRDLWPTDMRSRDVVDAVNADGLEPRWSEPMCRWKASNMKVKRPRLTQAGETIKMQTEDEIREASARFGAALWEWWVRRVEA